ncbi:MAG: META domain-containing protein [Cyclobacteriaceae bacterium]
MMRILSLLSIVTIFFLAGCNSGSTNEESSTSDENGISGEMAGENELPENMTNQLLENKKWVLTELLGQAISEDEVKLVPYIEFNVETGKYSGNSGCNNFTGEYELLEGDRIRLGQAASTSKACIDMTLENDFLKVLERADNYIATDSNMVLNRARMAPLARFKAE